MFAPFLEMQDCGNEDHLGLDGGGQDKAGIETRLFSGSGHKRRRWKYSY